MRAAYEKELGKAIGRGSLHPAGVGSVWAATLGGLPSYPSSRLSAATSSPPRTSRPSTVR